MPRHPLYKRSPELEALILRAVGLGCPEQMACALAQINHQTFYNWRHADPGFDARVRAAEAEAVAGSMMRIRQAARGGATVEVTTTTFKDGREVVTEKRTPPQWQADAWLLERRWPTYFGRRDTLTLRTAEVVEEARRLAVEAGEDPEAAANEAQLLLGPGGPT